MQSTSDAHQRKYSCGIRLSIQFDRQRRFQCARPVRLPMQKDVRVHCFHHRGFAKASYVWRFATDARQPPALRGVSAATMLESATSDRLAAG
jgi:hypothetical protein